MSLSLCLCVLLLFFFESLSMSAVALHQAFQAFQPPPASKMILLTLPTHSQQELETAAALLKGQQGSPNPSSRCVSQVQVHLCVCNHIDLSCVPPFSQSCAIFLLSTYYTCVFLPLQTHSDPLLFFIPFFLYLCVSTSANPQRSFAWHPRA